jgi:hypothetical protein
LFRVIEKVCQVVDRYPHIRTFNHYYKVTFCSSGELIKPYLSMHGVNTDIIDDDADVYPLHNDTLIEGVNINSINLITVTIILQDS